jgi:hypothetical protein
MRSWLLLGPARDDALWRADLAGRFRFVIGTRKGRDGAGRNRSGKLRESPAAGRLKTGPPACRGNATGRVRGQTRKPGPTSRQPREPSPARNRKPARLCRQATGSSPGFTCPHGNPAAKKPHPPRRGGNPAAGPAKRPGTPLAWRLASGSRQPDSHERRRAPNAGDRGRASGDRPKDVEPEKVT